MEYICSIFQYFTLLLRTLHQATSTLQILMLNSDFCWSDFVCVCSHYNLNASAIRLQCEVYDPEVTHKRRSRDGTPTPAQNFDIFHMLNWDEMRLDHSDWTHIRSRTTYKRDLGISMLNTGSVIEILNNFHFSFCLQQDQSSSCQEGFHYIIVSSFLAVWLCLSECVNAGLQKQGKKSPDVMFTDYFGLYTFRSTYNPIMFKLLRSKT